MKKQKYVIIGNSAAGIGAVEGIRQADKAGEITIISDEPHHTYSRPLISYMLLGKVTEDKMKYRPDAFYEENGCKLLHARAVSADTDGKCVVLDNGGKVPYDKLLVAAGSGPFVPPFEGLETVKDKFTFMTLDDAKALGEALPALKDEQAEQSGTREGKEVLIIGAGLIGLKCAEGIAGRASKITVVDLAPGILSSILDEDGAAIVQKHIESRGVEFILGESVKAFDGNKAVLSGGSSIAFDVLVLAVGVRPNTSLLSGIADIDRGIVINDKSETSAPDIYAAGDCAQATDISSSQSRVLAIMPNAYMQGECAGINMAGGQASFDRAMPMNAIGFFGLHIITAGNYYGDTYISKSDAGGNAEKYKKLFYSDNKLNGYIMIGDVDKAGIYTSLIRERTPLDSIDFKLVCERPGLMAFSMQERSAKLGSER